MAGTGRCIVKIKIIKEGERIMEFFGLLAPVAFVIALAALAQVGTLKKDVELLKEKLSKNDC